MSWFKVAELLLLFLYIVSVVLAGICPHIGWKYRNGICYQLFEEQLTRHEAETICRKYTTNITAHLASIASHDENMFISSVVADDTQMTWIGLSGNNDGFFTWTDGLLFSFSNWFDGEPVLDSEASASKDCVVTNYEVYNVPHVPAYWQAVDCNQLHPFVCKMRAF